MIDLTPVFLAVIALCGVAASAAALPLLRAKLGAERTEELFKWVRIAVAAAEQLYKSASGELKKKRVKAFLKEHGFDVDEAEVDKAIEAAAMATANDTLRIALHEIGATESPANSNRTKYGRWYDLDGYAWCMMFVQWCFAQARAAALLPVKTASCTSFKVAAQLKNNWNTGGYQPGDVALFDFSGQKRITQHVGIVESVGNGYVVTIEGNTSSGDSGSQDNGGGVFRRKRLLKYITGAFRPAYEEEEVMDMETINKMSDAELQRLFDRMQAALSKRTLSPGKFADEFKEAKVAGITDGTQPYALTTRAQAAVMAKRAMKK